MHRQFYTDTVGPGSKDHLALTTAFACTVGWSLKPGFTVLYINDHVTTRMKGPSTRWKCICTVGLWAMVCHPMLMPVFMQAVFFFLFFCNTVCWRALCQSLRQAHCSGAGKGEVQDHAATGRHHLQRNTGRCQDESQVCPRDIHDICNSMSSLRRSGHALSKIDFHT